MTFHLSRRLIMMTLIVVINAIMATFPALADGSAADIIAVGILSAPMMVGGVMLNIAINEGWAVARATLVRLFSNEPVYEITMRRVK